MSLISLKRQVARERVYSFRREKGRKLWRFINLIARRQNSVLHDFLSFRSHSSSATVRWKLDFPGFRAKTVLPRHRCMYVYTVCENWRHETRFMKCPRKKNNIKVGYVARSVRELFSSWKILLEVGHGNCYHPLRLFYPWQASTCICVTLFNGTFQGTKVAQEGMK